MINYKLTGVVKYPIDIKHGELFVVNSELYALQAGYNTFATNISNGDEVKLDSSRPYPMAEMITVSEADLKDPASEDSEESEEAEIIDELDAFNVISALNNINRSIRELSMEVKRLRKGL